MDESVAPMRDTDIFEVALVVSVLCGSNSRLSSPQLAAVDRDAAISTRLNLSVLVNGKHMK